MSSTQMAQPLRIMIVDDLPQRSAAVRTALELEGYCVVGEVSASDYLPLKVRELAPDVILIDVDAPGRDTLEHINAVNRDLPRPVVMFTPCTEPRLIQQAIRAGLVLYPVGPLEGPAIQPIIHTAIAQFQMHQQLLRERDEARNQLEDRRLIDQAKQILIDRQGLTEPQAHRWIQKTAMNTKRRLIDVARDLLAGTAAILALMETTL